MDSGLLLNIGKLPSATQAAFRACRDLIFFASSEWYLAGGTALALQVGHRVSVDLDFFSTAADFSRESFKKKLLATKSWQTDFIERGTLYGTFHKAKMSFIAYPYFHPSGDWLHIGKIRILKPHDIAVMKIIAISQRGRKRDFVDLYWYLRFFRDDKNLGFSSLREVLLRTVKQYPSQKENLPHFIKSLTYFVDAEEDPMPTLYFKVTWKAIKDYFKREVPQVARELLFL